MTDTNPAPAPAENAETLGLSERHKLMRDGLINNLTLVVSGLVGIAIVPLMLRWLGAESYGIWIMAMATSGMFAAVDLGLYPTVVREISSASYGSNSDASSFVEGAGNAYLLLGAVGALLLGIAGYFLSAHLHLDSRSEGTARDVFWLIGLGLLVDQLNLFGAAILAGLRRFDHANLIKSGAAILRAAGIVALLALGGSLISIAVWQVIGAAIAVGVTFFVVRRLVPHFRFRVAHLHWKELRQRLSFAVSSLLTTVFGGLAWQSGSLLIGFMQGSVSVVPFYIGEKLPYTAANFGWQAAEVLFPAAGENQDSLSRTREILKIGLRWGFILMLPVVTLLCIVGPNLLTVWIGKLDPDALGVLRLMSVTALADACMAASLNVLWGRAAMRKVVFTLLGVGVGTICLTIVLLPKMGVTGAAWGALVPTLAGACTLFYLACRECHADVAQMSGQVSRGLLLPAVGCALVAYLVSTYSGPGIVSLAGSCIAGSAVYIFLLYMAPGQNEERLFLQSAFRRVTSYL
jgi:O-antigen/teichoic acid export membrane protein